MDLGFQQFSKANGLRIENNLNGFRMIAVVAICRFWYFTTRVHPI
jgi:hypothetical protein